MLIRSTILALALGSFAAGCVADGSAVEETGTEAALSSPFSCQNVPDGCACVGGILVVPVDIDVKNVRVLNDVELNVLEDSLDSVQITDVLNVANGLDIYKLNVLNIFNNKLSIPVVGNDVNVCAVTVLGGLLCK